MWLGTRRRTSSASIVVSQNSRMYRSMSGMPNPSPTVLRPPKASDTARPESFIPSSTPQRQSLIAMTCRPFHEYAEARLPTCWGRNRSCGSIAADRASKPPANSRTGRASADTDSRNRASKSPPPASSTSRSYVGSNSGMYCRKARSQSKILRASVRTLLQEPFLIARPNCLNSFCHLSPGVSSWIDRKRTSITAS